MYSKRTYNIIVTGLMAALIAVCSWIAVPFGAIPFTMQTFAVFMTAILTGPVNGTVAVVLYILIGIVGVPVFSAFQSGPGVVLGATGGFIVGFVFITLIGGFFCRKFRGNTVFSVIGLLAGLLCCYVTGVMWYAYGYLDSADIGVVLSTTVLPYIVPDILKCVLAVIVAKKVGAVLKGRMV